MKKRTLTERKAPRHRGPNNAHGRKRIQLSRYFSEQEAFFMVDVILESKRWALKHPGDEEALLEAWLVDEGDHVEAGQLLCKASLQQEGIDVAAPEEGVVEQIAVASGERFGPGYILARLANT